MGIGFIIKARFSFSLFLFLLAGFFLDARRDDLKLPLLGNFTIHEGGTIIEAWQPEMKRNSSSTGRVCSCLSLDGNGVVKIDKF